VLFSESLGKGGVAANVNFVGPVKEKKGKVLVRVGP
jgi:hypothetical protein